MCSLSTRVDVRKDSNDLISVSIKRQFFVFSNPRSENAFRFVRQLALIATGANNEID